jgi:hypothetical protein
MQCGGPPVESVWRTGQIKIDGIPDEWQSSALVGVDKKMQYGIMNDDKYLYICVSTTDRSVAERMVRAGSTLWLYGEKGMRFGLMFPGGHNPSGERHHGFGDERNQEDGSFTDNGLLEEINEVVQIYDADRQDMIPVKEVIAESLGISARIRPTRNNCVLEIKIPLQKTIAFPYAICPDKSFIVPVTIEANELELPKEHHAEEDGGSHGGAGHKHGGGGGGMSHGGMNEGGMAGGITNNGESPNYGRSDGPFGSSYKVEFKILLAHKDTDSVTTTLDHKP